MDIYGLVGFPLGHSFSQQFFNTRFEQEGRQAQYCNFELPSITLFPKLIEEKPQLRGLNVTIPYKEQIIPYLDALSDEAREIGAVNVIKPIWKNGEIILKGYNTDVIGFMQSIRPLLQPHHTKALILGTGGASKAIAYGLQKLGLAIRYVSRTIREEGWLYADITETVLKDYTVLINCTPVGMFPHTDECPALPYNFLNERHLLYDLVYNPEETLFLQKGKKQGATIKNGLEMLHLQALAAWDIWQNDDL